MQQVSPPPSKKQAKPEPKPKASKRFWPPIPTIILTVGVFFASQILAAIIIGLVPLLYGWNNAKIDQWMQTSFAQFLLVVMIEGFVILMLWGLLHIRRTTFRDIGLSWPRIKDVAYAILGFGIYFLLYLGIAMLAKLAFPSLNFDQPQQVGFEAAKHGSELILVFISLVLLPPFVEEVLVRGFLYTGLKTKWPIWLATLITSLMFASAHLEFGSGAPLLWIAAIDTFTLSLVLIYLREKTGKLGASIMLHMLKNGIAFVLLFVVGIK